MIDSRASRNFAFTTFVMQKGIATQCKKQGYKLIIVDRLALPSIEQETILLLLAIQQHHKEITLDITNMASYDIVLKIPWLRQHNLVIN